MAAKTLPDRDYLREAFAYNPETGELLWRERPAAHFPSDVYRKRWNSRRAGTIAGTLHSCGYSQIHLCHRLHFAHRIAWLIVHGEPMPIEIDHIDGNRGNNRITNLRAATRSENKVIRPTVGSDTGIRGVRFSKGGRFNARIMLHRQEYNLGTYDTLAEAAAVRREAAERMFGEFARHGLSSPACIPCRSLLARQTAFHNLGEDLVAIFRVVLNEVHRGAEEHDVEHHQQGHGRRQDAD